MLNPTQPFHRRLPSMALFALLLGSSAPIYGQSKPEAAQADPAKLTLDRIFQNREFQAEHAPALRWTGTAGRYLTQESGPGGTQFVSHDPVTGKEEVIIPSQWLIPSGETSPLAVHNYEFTANGDKLLIYTNSKKVWRQNTRGDYWVLDLTSRELRKLGGEIPNSTTMFATFSPDGKRVAYVHENNLYVQDLRDFRIMKLTSSTDSKIINGTFDWVYEEELDLRNGFRWSPDSQSIAYWEIDSRGVKDFFITLSNDGPYAKLLTIPYPKTGEKNSAARIGVVRIDKGEGRYINLPGDPREHYLAKMEWSGNEIAIQQFNRLQNTNRVFLADPQTGNSRVILTETEKTWVENHNEFTWLDNGSRFVWLSERDGWNHIYLVSRDGKQIEPLTKGPYDVISITSIDEAGGWIYFKASLDNSTQRYLYRVSLKGGPIARVTPANEFGTHDYFISPDSKWAVHTVSSFAKPPVTTLVELPNHNVVKTFTDNEKLRKKLDTLKLGPSEFFRVNVDKDTAIDGWCIKPKDLDPSKKYPLFVYVYGEPAAQTVLDRWDARNYLWFQMLAQQGYVVISMDNRGTPAPKGRDWRRSIYRQVGVLASSDQANATKALLKERPYLDPGRIAIFGWSGGGSMSLNAIFRYPDLYQTAMSVAPVPNQRMYDTIYQERYMGLPSDNADGYRNGSPITFAKQLKGNLLIVHGTGDDNCHFLGVETLIDELIANNKRFTMMAYPNRSHSISEGRNTTRHLYELLTNYLNANTPPQGR
ncbi:MAG: S9 family peptidase [Gemmataceae bacterium]